MKAAHHETAEPVFAARVPAPRFSARLKGRMVTSRRMLKNAEEEARALAGAVRRTIGLERPPAPTPLFEPRFFAIRPFPDTLDDGGVGVDAKVVTPDDGAFMHTFFDVCPLSASGRHLAVTRLPFEHRGPWPGDMAEICVIDLEAATIRTVYRTGGWALQLGANIHWHPHEDHLLFCNDLREGRAIGVMVDLLDKRHRRYEAPFYALDPGGRFMLSPALDLVNRTQYGYGVPERLTSRRRLPRGAARDEGLWRTDLESGRVELVAGIADLVDVSPARELLKTGFNYLFHTKIDRQGERVFQVLCSIDLADRPGAVRSRIMTLDAEGSTIREALPHEAWDRGGHHPSWLPDGGEILMNLVSEDGGEMRFVRFPEDGSAPPCTLGERRGSGHPSLDPSGRLLLTDAYLNEGFDAGGGQVPLRLIDLDRNRERWPLGLDCGPPDLRARRVDPHPVWSRDGRRAIMNTVIDGRRQVVIADLGGFLRAAGCKLTLSKTR